MRTEITRLNNAINIANANWVAAQNQLDEITKLNNTTQRQTERLKQGARTLNTEAQQLEEDLKEKEATRVKEIFDTQQALHNQKEAVFSAQIEEIKAINETNLTRVEADYKNMFLNYINHEKEESSISHNLKI